METFPDVVIQRLRSSSLSVRTGLWLAPHKLIGTEADAAARLSLDASDLCRHVLAVSISGSHFLGLDLGQFARILDEIAKDQSGSDCRLIYNLDIVLAYFRPNERNEIWQHILWGLTHRTVALLFFLPSTASLLYPSERILHEFESAGRLAS